MICLVCGVDTNKYKCSKCKEPYCSLNCYKEHQKTGCESLQPLATDILLDAVSEQEPTIHEPFRTEDTVSRTKLALLEKSSELQNLLYNKHLRNLLTEIDVAPNAWKAMKAAMNEPLFLEFADECLKIIEPPTVEE